MSDNAFVVTTTPDEHGGEVVEITGVDLGNDTVSPETLVTGVTAHDAEGLPITGTLEPGPSLVNDTVSPETLALGITAHDAEGLPIVGTMDPDSYTYLEPIELDTELSVEDYDLEVDISDVEYVVDLGTAIQNIIIQGKIPPGGQIGDLLAKRSLDDYDVGWVTPATHAEQDNTRPITAGAVYTEIGNINALLATI